jgi:Domain of unknown function (DUF4265)
VPDFVKIRFPLEQDADGWPPAHHEGLWAVPVEGDTFRLDNTPWFARDIASGDIVRAEMREDEWWFLERLHWSGNCTIRVIPFRHGPIRGDRKAILEMFDSLGVTGEGVERFGMVVLHVPPEADLAAVQRLLKRGFDEGWWDYEEGCVGDAWLQIASQSPQ